MFCLRSVFVALLSSVVAGPATTQTTLGIKGGVGFATYSTSVAGVAKESSPGVFAGVDLSVPVSPVLGLRFAGAYAQKSFGSVGVLRGVSVTNVTHIDYIHLSSLARVATTSTAGISVGAMTGPWVAFRISCDAEATAQGVNVGASCADAGVDVKTTDFGLAFGAGVDFPISGNFRLGLDAIFSLGLLDIDNHDEYEFRSRHWAAQTGVIIPIR